MFFQLHYPFIFKRILFHKNKRFFLTENVYSLHLTLGLSCRCIADEKFRL